MELFLEESIIEDEADPSGKAPYGWRKAKRGRWSHSWLPRALYRGWPCGRPWPPRPQWPWNVDEEDGKLPVSVFVPPRATLDLPVPPVLLEKTVLKVLEETVVPLAELVTPVFKVLQELLVTKENLEMMVPLYVP